MAKRRVMETSDKAISANLWAKIQGRGKSEPRRREAPIGAG